MIKNITLIILLFLIVMSCGKKSCPKSSNTDECSELFKQS